VNRAAFEYAGVGPEQVMGERWRELFHGDDLPGYERVLAEAFASHRPYEVDCRVRRADGAFRWMLITGVPRFTGDGEFEGFAGCAIDITDRKEAEARLRDEVAERRRAEQVSRGQKCALVRTLHGLAANPSLDAYLGEVLKALAEQLHEPMAGLWLTEGDDIVRLYMDYQDGRAVLAEQTDHPGARRVPPNAKYLRDLATRPQIFDVANDPALADYRQYLMDRGVQGILVVPMFFGDQTIGAFSVRSTRRKNFAPEEVELAQTLAHQATLAIQLTRLAQKERESARRQRRDLEERVRERTAELHHAVSALHEEVIERQRAERVSRGQTEALARTLDLLAAEPDLDTFLGHVLSTITQQLDAPASTFWFYDPKRHAFDLHMSCDEGRISVGRFDGADGTNGTGGAATGLPKTLDDSRPAIRRLLETRRPVALDDVLSDPQFPEHRDWLRDHGVKSIMLVPVMLGDAVLGVIAVHNTRCEQWQPGEAELAQALARQASLAVQLTRLAQRGQQSAVLEERNRMAREIHDTLAQSFTGIVIHQEAAKRILPPAHADHVEQAGAPSDGGAGRAWESRAEDVRQHIVRTLELARTGLTEARRSVGKLRSEMLPGVSSGRTEGRDDLPAALSRLVEQMTAGTDVRGEAALLGEPRPLPTEVRGELMRIGQEALTNALRHGEPSRVQVELTFEPGAVRLRVWDDGRGFDPSAVGTAGAGGAGTEGGFGLTGMRERAEQVGGRLLVTSQPEGGTEVIVEVQT
jgi:PAS domain S-box-containing protein